MGAMSLKTKRSKVELSSEELMEMMRTTVRQVLREEITSVRVDPRGYLIFPNEEEYAAYLTTQPGKLPSEIKASFIDPQGLRVHYSDYELTPKKARELAKRRNERTVPGAQVWEELRKLGVE